MGDVFKGSFTQQEPIPEAGIEAALRVLRHGRLHRYNLAEGEAGETALLEEEFAEVTGAQYALAVASGGYAMGCAMRALGVTAGDKVLSNGFTLAPVPGAVASLGAEPVFVEVTRNLTLDLDDLQAKIATSGAKVLLLSHMRGHLTDMPKLMALCNAAGVSVIEDCAHTMGAAWEGVPSGRFGAVGCFSMQTYKHVNAGEGGFLITDDAELAARMILLSGSYMLYARHRASPPVEVFERLRFETPNISGRMDNLRAAILRPQIANLPAQVERWAARYKVLEAGLAHVPGIELTKRPDEEIYVGSSFQFLMPGHSAEAMRAYVARCGARGVELKWFGADDPVAFTSRYDHWAYAPGQSLPQTDAVLQGLIDMRVPLTFCLEDYALIALILAQEAEAVVATAAE